MRVDRGRFLIAGVASLWLTGCETSTRFGDLIGSTTPADPQAAAFPAEPGAAGDPATTASVPTSPELLGSNPNDDLSLGKKHYRAANYGLAERYFRRAAELHPRDVEAWIGLAAAYDRLRRFELADRAYKQATGIVGPTPELLNNHGYSYILRGDYKRARETLVAAQIKDPKSPYIKNNLELLEQSTRQGKAVQ
jgi:Flp pilus assembly protein TadD